MKNFTILIPVYHQYEKLYRLLSFLKGFKESFEVIILDSSVRKAEVSFDIDFKYLSFDSDTPLIEKIYQGLDFVKTEYSVLCADDDFIMPSAVMECVDFLSLNKDYVVAHGQYISFLTTTINEKEKFFWGKRYDTPSNEENNPILRIEKYYSIPMSPNFYGVYRTVDHKTIMKITRKSGYDIRFEERLQASVALLIGKEKRLDSFYYSREKVKEKKIIDDMDSYVKYKTFDEKYQNYKAVLVDFIKSNNYSMANDFNNQIDDIFFDFVEKLTARNKKSLSSLVKGVIINTTPLYKFINFVLRRKDLYERTMLSDGEMCDKYRDVLKVKTHSLEKK